MAKCYMCKRTFYKVLAHCKKFHPRKYKQVLEEHRQGWR